MTFANGLKEMIARIDEAAAVARASLVFADARQHDHALRIIMDIDELLHEAIRLHDAIRLVGYLDGAIER